jgi:hypothetical protein
MISQLFVLSPYADIAAVAALLKTAERNHLLCAHLLTPSEQRQLQAADDAVHIELMRDFVSDGELERLDEEVHTNLMNLAREAEAAELIQLAHTPLYVQGIKRARNRLVAEKFLGKYGRPDRLLVCSGPNVDVILWCEVCSGIEQVNLPWAEWTEHTPIRSCTPPASARPPSCDIAVTSLNGLKRTRLIDKTILDGRCIEVGELRRALARQGVRPGWDFIRSLPALCRIRGQQQRLRRRLKWKDASHMSGAQSFLSWRAWASIAVNLLALHSARRRGVRCLVSSIHSFSSMQAWAARKAGVQVLVLQDGYLPINYPVSLYYQYRGATMVWWSEPARRWGARAGLAGFTVKPDFSSSSPQGDSLPAPSAIKHVIAPMNHGGEWTSLIWRCDLDRFVQGILEVARRLPGLEFRLRPHQTGNVEMHDGVNCLERLRSHVAESGVGNVTLSSCSLAEDLSWADFAVSEYSLTLLEYVESSAGGVAVFNPTKRRDFYSEFTNQGLPYAETADDLLGILIQGTRGGRDAFQSMLDREGDGLRPLLAALDGETTPDPRTI